jgi:hypothetical protein
MPLPSFPSAAPDSVELGQLLSSTVESVVAAQHKLDEFTLARAREREAAAPGELALPPLWYTFRRVAIEIEMAASVTRSSSPNGGARTELRCRPLDPAAVSLYGYQASSGLRVRVELAPHGYAEIVPPRNTDAPRDGEPPR